MKCPMCKKEVICMPTLYNGEGINEDNAPYSNKYSVVCWDCFNMLVIKRGVS